MRAAFQHGTPDGAESPALTPKGTAGLVAGLRGEEGSSAVEFTLTFMVFFTLVLGIMEVCMMCYTYAVLEDAAREGVRYAIVHGSDSSSCQGPSTGCDSTAASVKSDVSTYAQSFAGNLSNMVVTVSYPDGTSTVLSRVQVSITQSYTSVFKVPGFNQSVTVSSSGRILY
jgi:Flp pilus assembly protein TadG